MCVTYAFTISYFLHNSADLIGQMAMCWIIDATIITSHCAPIRAVAEPGHLHSTQNQQIGSPNSSRHWACSNQLRGRQHSKEKWGENPSLPYAIGDMRERSTPPDMHALVLVPWHRSQMRWTGKFLSNNLLKRISWLEGLRSIKNNMAIVPV